MCSADPVNDVDALEVEEEMRPPPPDEFVNVEYRDAGFAAAPGTEPPRERPEAWRAGRLMVFSALSGAAFIGLIWWLT